MSPLRRLRLTTRRCGCLKSWVVSVKRQQIRFVLSYCRISMLFLWDFFPSATRSPNGIKHHLKIHKNNFALYTLSRIYNRKYNDLYRLFFSIFSFLSIILVPSSRSRGPTWLYISTCISLLKNQTLLLC